MRKLNRSFLNILLVAVLTFAFNIVAFAQGTTSISVSKNSAQVGDSISVTASGSENGSITVKYTSSMLQFMDCNVSGYKSEGNAITFSGKEGTIKFKAIADGTASVIVSSSANSGSSTTLTIGGSAPAQAPAPTEEAPAEETPAVEVETEETPATEEAPAAPAAAGTGTLNANGGFDIGGVSYVVSERYSDSEMPAGFSKTTITIGSSTYSEPTNGALTLLYLKPADNTAGSGVFYLYNADAGTVSPFLMLGTSKSYVILAAPDAPLSASLTETTIEVTGGTATAYTMDGAEFFYVYGANQDGAVGWFLYDKTYNTVSRVDAAAFSAGSADTAVEEAPAAETVDTRLYIEKLNLYRKIIMGLIVLCVILLFIIINKAIKGNSEDDDDFDGDVFASAPKRTSKKLPRSIVFKHDDYDEEDEDEDDNDDEYDDDEEYYDDDELDDDDLEEEEEYYQSESYESRRASSLNMMDLNDL